MERVTNLVGPGSQTTARVREALRVELSIRDDRPQRPPSRNPACCHTIGRVRDPYTARHLVLNSIVANRRLYGSAVFRPKKPVGRRRELTPRKVFGVTGA